MFSERHLLFLLICAVLTAGATVLSVRRRLPSRTAAKIFAVICVLSELVKDMASMIPSEFGGLVLDPNDIPLHLCSMIVFAVLLLTFTKRERLREGLLSAVVTAGTVAPLFALLLPTEGVDFSRAQCWQYFLYHAALLWFSLHHLLTGQAEMGARAYRGNLAVLSVIVLLMLYINSALSSYGVNFYFLRMPPAEGLPLLNLEHGWYHYFAVLLLIGYGSVTLIHAPFLIREKRQAAGKRKE